MLPCAADLAYFLEVARILNLSRASESLGISQPSLTLSIKRLEKSLGTAILIRHKRGVTLTKAGKQLLGHTRQLLQIWDAIKAETLASINEIQGCFTIGCHTSLSMYALPRFLAPLLEKNPKLDIKLKHDLSRKITEQVINFDIDIGIATNPTKHPDLIIKHLDDGFIKVWRSSNTTKIQDFASGEAVLLCDPEMTQTQIILKKLKKSGHQYARIIPSNNLEVIADLTKKGCGIGILPHTVAIARELELVPKTPTHKDEICLLYRGENRNVKAIQVITQAIKEAFV